MVIPAGSPMTLFKSQISNLKSTIRNSFVSVALLCALAPLLILAACALGSPLTDSEQLGQRLFLQNCDACHATAGDAIIVGPSLAGVAARAQTRVASLDARAYLEQSITDPSAYLNPGFSDVMPKSFGSFFSAEELDALVGYLMTLK